MSSERLPYEMGCKCPEWYYQKNGACLGWRKQMKCESVIK